MANEKQRLANRTKRHLGQSKEQIDGFSQSLVRFLDRGVERIAVRLREGKADALEAAQILGRLEQELERLGLNDIIIKVSRLHAAELQFIRDEFQELGVKQVFADIDRDAIDALIEFDTNRIGTHVQAFLGDAKATMMRSILGGQTATPGLDVFSPRLEANVKTELNTSLAAFNRSVSRKKAKDLGFDKFIYLGPDDKVTRPFCQERVGNIYTQEEIDSWDNEQGLPANIYLGGYNCRHQLRPVRDAD